MSEEWFTLGVEEEFQIIAPDGELQAAIDALLADAGPVPGDDVKPEMLQSVVEVGTRVCDDVTAVRAEIHRLRGALCALLVPHGLRIASAGTHPFSRWQDQRTTELERYQTLEEELQDVVRELLIFGTQVHVGIPDPDMRIEIMNEARYFLPHLLALSTSSPFWLSRRTGLKSYRSVIWSPFPRTGIPPHLASAAEYHNLVEVLVRTGCIDDATKIWWDVRPHPVYPTLEFRICDATTRVDEVVCLAALYQAICAKLVKLRRGNLGFRTYLPMLIAENKWRAVRHGIEGKLVDFGRRAEVPVPQLVAELLEFVDDVVDELGSRTDVEYVHTILRDGTSADRQLAVYAQTGSLQAVVEHVVAETMQGVPVPA